MGALSLQVIADWLVTFAIHSTCALILAVVASMLLRTRWPQWQERVLRFSLWGALLSSSLQLAFATTPLSLSLAAADSGAALPVAVGADGQAGEAPHLLAAEPTLLSQLSPVQWLVATALGCALLGGLWLLRMYLRLRWVLRSREPETDGRTLAIAADVARSLGLRQSPHVSSSAEILTPIAFGCLRPEICLPLRAGSLDDDELRAMLAHEVGHLQRLDPLWMWLAAALNALFPWQPLLIVARRRWAHLVELRCDAIAAGQTSPTAVARCLLDVAGWIQPGRQMPVVALPMAARPSALRQRVEAALHEVATGNSHRAWSLCASGFSLLTLTFVAPGADSTTIARPPSVGSEVSTMLASGLAPAGSIAALRSALAMLDSERQALLEELSQLRAEVQHSELQQELDPLLAQLTQSLDRVQQKCQHLAVLIDSRQAQESPFQSR